ncbi:MAG: DUF3592 domain-containing protein [Lysobacterales bacterium]|nr:MAG: DUF3592 domain-containing protein [Xanthomonadales bacterium]
MLSIRSTRSETNRQGAGCLMLFAVPFAAVGVGALVWSGWTLLDWREAAGWVPVPAEVVAVELEEHTDSEGDTTYETTATYRYEYAGTSYTGTRVAIDTGADNIGRFQHRLYYDLTAAHEKNTPVTAYVDPDDANRAVLNRELRPGLFALKGIFAIVFGGVGFALLFGARHAAKKLATEETLRVQFPGEPWRWRPEWANGRIAGSARAAAYVAIAFAVLWNLISLPAALIAPGEIADGNNAAAVALLFPLIGLGLAAWAIRAWLQLKRFKVPTLTLQRLPIALGGRLRGTIRVESEVPVTADFGLELECVETRTRGSGKNRRTEEKLLWQKQWRVPRHQCQIGSFTTIPVDVALPAGQPATTMEAGDGRITWRLEVAGQCPGPDFWSRFELPVFDTADAHDPVETPVAGAPAHNERPTSRALAALGIDYERTPQGGEAWTFRRGQHKGVALAITAFAVVWSMGSLALFASDAPVVIAIVFGLFDAVFVWWALSLWLTEYHVTLDRGLLTLARRGFMARKPVEIPQQWIRAVRTKRGMQAGNKLYYDLEIETADGKHTAASSLPDYDVASWLARHWAAGNTRA